MKRSLDSSLKTYGMLMLSDPRLPSAVGLAAGRKVRGSWWGDPKGHEIFRKLQAFESGPDVLSTRLVSGKVTFLHRDLWVDFLSVAVAREVWQLKGISAGARRLLKSVDAKGMVRTDEPGAKGKGPQAREIEGRLLAYGEEIHTDRGAHAKVLMSWSRCPKIEGLKISLRPPGEAKHALEIVLDGLNRRYGASGSLPWRQN